MRSLHRLPRNFSTGRATVSLADPSQDVFVHRLRAKNANVDGHQQTVTEYLDRFKPDKADLRNTAHAEEQRRRSSQTMTNQYYDLATDFYERGWGQSFHFARIFKGDSLQANIARHEAFLGHRLQLSPGMKVLDVGCGVGGPLRELSKLTGAHITGLNNNKYQVERCQVLNDKAGVGPIATAVQGDFCKMPFESNSFDACYQIEATCHAPRLEEPYAEIFRVLKPGGLFGSYEWCTTEKYDESNLEMKEVIHLVEQGNSISKFYTIPQCIAALKSVGFEILEVKDLASPENSSPMLEPWYSPLNPEGVFSRTPIGSRLLAAFVWLLERLKIAPKGTVQVKSLLTSAGDNLVKAGKMGIFTPMLFCLVRKPLQ
ncbi:S-adenosyl-L-methionine-dependent methyltransferase [Obelidium mucronatum]|nr:S-adenosyl-L-methionine-dependent methyltransferase [Obelidium mucronatum]